MVMNYRETGRPHGQGEYAKGVALMNGFAAGLAKKGLLPEEFPEPQAAPMESQVSTLTEGVEAVVLPTKEQLIASEKEALAGFFGKDYEVPEPPAELFATLEHFETKGVRGFEPHYLPGVTLKEGDEFPGWKVKPEKWFWQRLEDGSIEKGASLQEGWYLVDGRGKPNYNDGQQRYEDDARLAATIDELRAAGKIKVYGSVPTDSRFGASPDEIEQVILPEFARYAQPQGELRKKRYIEFNIWGNMFHSEWGQTNTWEWFADKFDGGLRLVGGDSGSGGLASVDGDWSDDRDGDTGFSPVVVFSSKTG